MCCIKFSVIRCTLFTVLYLAVPCVPDRVTRSALIAHSPLRCRTSKYRRTLFPSQCLFGTVLLTLYSMVEDWRVLRAGPMLFDWAKPLTPHLSYALLLSSISLLYIYRLVLWGLGLLIVRMYFALSQSCVTDLFS